MASGRNGQSFKNLLGDIKKLHTACGYSADRGWYKAFSEDEGECLDVGVDF